MGHATQRNRTTTEKVVRRPKYFVPKNSETLQRKGNGGRPPLSHGRRDARARASLRFGRAIDEGGSTNCAVADVIGVREGVVRRWRNPDDTLTIQDGDFDLLREHMPRLMGRYRALVLEDYTGGPLPDLDDDEHNNRIALAALELQTTDGVARTRALRKLLGYTTAALRDATGEDE